MIPVHRGAGQQPGVDRVHQAKSKSKSKSKTVGKQWAMGALPSYTPQLPLVGLHCTCAEGGKAGPQPLRRALPGGRWAVGRPSTRPAARAGCQHFAQKIALWRVLRGVHFTQALKQAGGIWHTPLQKLYSRSGGLNTRCTPENP